MTREQAAEMIRVYLARYGLRSEGLNASNIGGLRVGDADLYFVYEPATRMLICQALIYRSLFPLDERTVDGIKAAAKTRDAGDGKVEHQADNNGLFLVRRYKDVAPASDFAAAMRSLMVASLDWNQFVIDRFLPSAKGSRA